jgi:hypothetical protein
LQRYLFSTPLLNIFLLSEFFFARLLLIIAIFYRPLVIPLSSPQFFVSHMPSFILGISFLAQFFYIAFFQRPPFWGFLLYIVSFLFEFLFLIDICTAFFIVKNFPWYILLFFIVWIYLAHFLQQKKIIFKIASICTMIFNSFDF